MSDETTPATAAPVVDPGTTPAPADPGVAAAAALDVLKEAAAAAQQDNTADAEPATAEAAAAADPEMAGLGDNPDTAPRNVDYDRIAPRYDPETGALVVAEDGSLIE